MFETIATRSSATLLFATFVMLAGPSSAATFFGEVFTSELFGDLHATAVVDLDFAPFDFSIFDLDVSSPGLGSATIPPSKTVTFSVDPALGSIEQAWLFIGLTDDLNPFYDPLDIAGMLTEVAVIEFNGTTWTDEVNSLDWAFAPIFGNVTAELLADRTNFVVNISSDPEVGGDFQIITAALKVKLGGVVGVVPEPHAALLFCVGALTVGALRRR